jgi:small subunit ribosomal protein S2
VALVDTNADPSQVSYPIPANDDAIKTIQLIADYVKSAILAGKSQVKTVAEDKPKTAPATPKAAPESAKPAAAALKAATDTAEPSTEKPEKKEKTDGN